jgi:signal peptidase
MGRQLDPLAVVRWIFDGLLLVVVLAVIAAFVVARGLPAVGHETLVVTGRSMETAVPFGSMVALESVEIGAIGPGDVVTVRVPDGRATLTHRVVDAVDRDDGHWLRTQGDANAEPDPALVPVGWVVGRVAVVIPWLGYVVLLLSSVTGTLAILSLSLTLYLAARLVEDLEWGRRRARPGAMPAMVPAPVDTVAVTGPPTAPTPDPAHRHATAIRRGRRGARVRRWEA